MPPSSTRRLRRPAHAAYVRAEKLARGGLFRFLPRQRWAILFVLGVLALSPLLSRWLAEYRVVILSRQGNDVLVLGLEQAGASMKLAQGAPGTMVIKRRWAWTPELAPAAAQDRPLVELYERYAAAYEGVVIALNPAPDPQARIRIRTASGEERLVPLSSQALARLRPGQPLRKRAEQWDPEPLMPTP